LGDDEEGVEFWVADQSGKRKAFQCKARNANADYWTAGALNAKAIFRNAKSQLDRNSDAEYHFVSAVDAIQVKDICDKARNSNDWQSFYKYQIKNSQKRKQQFATICRGFQLSENNEGDIEKVYYYLQKIFFNQYPDDPHNKSDLLNRISYLIEGNAESIYTLLITFAEENDYLGQKITANDLWNFLEKNNCCPKRLAKDPRIMPAIKAQQTKYEESIKNQGLVKGILIKRNEAQQCLEEIKNGNLIFFYMEHLDAEKA